MNIENRAPHILSIQPSNIILSNHLNNNPATFITIATAKRIAIKPNVLHIQLSHPDNSFI